MQPELNHGLEQVQRWMQAVIMHPGGVEQGVASSEARQHVDLSPAAVEQLVTCSRALSAVDRLAIYGYAYYARLLECLKEEYPAVAHAVGEEPFSSFALGYLRRYPSRRYTLFELGAKFPAYLRDIRPPDDDPDGGVWTDFVIDLAVFERAVSEVFDGPGSEEGPLLTAGDLHAVDGEQLALARLACVESLRLLALRFPVEQFQTAVRNKEAAVPPDPAETYYAVTRRNYVVCHHMLVRPAYELLRALVAGGTLAEAIERAALCVGLPDCGESATSLDAGGASLGPENDERSLLAELPTWFSDWAARGYFRAIELPG